MTRTLKYQIIKDWLVEQAADPASRKAMPSIRQIRKHFGVSLAPVTRALQELEAEGLIERRQGASTVTTNRNRTINKASEANTSLGTIISVFPDYPSEVYWRMSHALEHQARMQKLNLQMYKFDHTLDLDDVLRFAGSQDHCRGLMLTMGSDALSITQLEQLGVSGMPVTLCDHLFEYENLPENITILSPNASMTAEMGVWTLHEMGHRKLGYFRNEPKTDQGDQKLASTLKTARQLGIELDKRAVFSTAIKSWSSSMDAAMELTREALPVIRELGLTALMYQSTPGAYAACQVFYEAGIRVGKDISVISGGDYEFAQYACPALTVMASDYVQMAKDAVNLLIDRPAGTPSLIKYPPSLIKRNSVCRID